MFLRSATPADIPAMRALDLASTFGARWTEAHYYGLFATADCLKHLVLVAEKREAREAVVAYLTASGVGAEWKLENIIVASQMVRQGIARALIEELLERLRREGVQRLHLEVRESNQPARALYASLRFAEGDRRLQYYTSPIEDAIVLSLAL